LFSSGSEASDRRLHAEGSMGSLVIVGVEPGAQGFGSRGRAAESIRFARKARARSEGFGAIARALGVSSTGLQR
jgi:hypothetical protein